MQAATRIVIADDHPIVRRGLRQILEEEPSFQVVAEAADGAEGLKTVQTLRPEVAILDLHMPKMDGFAVVKSMQGLGLDTRTIFLTIHAEVELLNRAFEIGVRGYVLKDSALVDIVNAVNSVVAGTPFVSPSLAAAILNHRSERKTLEATHPGLRELTPAERRVLTMIAAGKATKDIAAELHVHPRTIETHRGSICGKLGLSGANSLLRFALQNKGELS